MRYAVIGAGGVGGLLAGLLARGGNKVTLVLRESTYRAHPRSISVSSSTFGEFSAPVETALTVENGVDVIIVSVKEPHLSDAMEELEPSRVGRATIVPFLNGFEHVERMRRRYGREVVLPGAILVEAERVGVAEIAHRRPGVKVMLGAGVVSRATIDAVASDFAACGVEAEVWDDEQAMLWSKLVMLAPLALSTTAVGGDLGSVRADPAVKPLMEAAFREVATVASSRGVTVDVHATLAAMEAVDDSFSTSMEKDVRAGREPEADAIAGAIIRAALQAGIPVPALEELAARVDARVRH